ncbi:MAG: TRAM domain-containing protein, partial [Desulfobacterales bacterium]
MIVKKGQLVELKISDIAFGGKGVARINGLTVFVDQAVPLDLIIARIIKKKKNYAEARVVEMVQPSPFRSAALCIYSGFCGGCRWQFLKYDKQLFYKRQHVIESIEHIGLIRGVTVHSTLPSKQIFGYRNKMEFTCSDQRWLLPDELGKEKVSRDFALGLHPSGNFYKIIDTRVCHLQPKLGNQILETVRSYMKGSGAPPYDMRNHVGFWRYLMLRHSF